jgi:hypothetical protein
LREEIERLLRKGIKLRRRILGGLDHDERVRLLETLLEDFFVTQRSTLLKWAALTGQSAQIDTGYIAQHVASIVLSEPGQGFKGKGVDLADGSEVKSAAILSGIDRPRWNHNLGTPADDQARAKKGLEPTWAAYLNAPVVFYLLFDRTTPSEREEDFALRVRAWCVDPTEDVAWRDLVTRFIQGRKPSQYNFQLHPPVGYDDDEVVNTLGNLNMAAVKVLEARMTGFREHENFQIEWIKRPLEQVRPVKGQCEALPYGGRGSRPSRLTPPVELEADLDELSALVPGLDLEALAEAVEADVTVVAEEEKEEEEP